MLTRAVTRGASRPLVVADMPFGSFQVSDELAVTNAIRFVKDAGADAVKLEGAGTMLSRVHAIVGAGIPVMGHIGLTPQSATALGGFKAQGRTAAKAAQLVRRRARARGGRLLRARARSRSLAGRRRRSPSCSRSRRSASAPAPTVDGQVLVWHDLLGLYDGHAPQFVKQYAAARGARSSARSRRTSATFGSGRFPEEVHTYGMPAEELAAFEAELDRLHVRRATGSPARPELRARTARTANAATITAASASAPTTPRHGSSNVVRSPSGEQPERPERERKPDCERRRHAPCRRPSLPS